MSISDVKANAVNCTIRLYKDSDADAVMEICRITAHPKLQAEPIRTIIPYFFALPYIKLHPSYSWVVADQDDKAISYIVAVPDSAEYLRRIKEEYFPLFEADCLPKLEKSNPGLYGTLEKVKALLNRFCSPDSSILHPSWPELLQKYPCHIHIDILPGYQGQNLGRRLMNELIRKLENEKVEGIHLMMSGDNVGTKKFCERVGFGRWPVEMGGERGEGEVGVKPEGGVWYGEEG